MQAKYRWLLLPPALALVLFLGPLRSPSSPVNAAAENAGKAVSTMPDAVQMISTLVGVLLLGVAGVLVVARFKGHAGGNRPSTDLLTVRQRIRLSSRHAVYALQFENELLLVGECDGSLSVLQRTADPQAIEDEAVATDSGTPEDDDGAVPRDLVIPRPSAAARRRAPIPARAAEPATRRPADFQALLKLARRGS